MPGAFNMQVGDSDLLNTDFGGGTSGGTTGGTTGGYGYGVNYGRAGVLETIAPQANGTAAATGGDQSADFNLYLGYAERVVGLINPFTAQYQNEQGIRRTQEETNLQNAKNAGGYAAPAKDMTVVYVIAGVAVVALFFVLEKKD